jgi:hypothetical protein
MQTECTPSLFELAAVGRRAVVAQFDGGTITSNAGALLLGQVDRALHLIQRFPRCFTEYRGTEEVNEGLGVEECSDGDGRAQGSAELDQGVH